METERSIPSCVSTAPRFRLAFLLFSVLSFVQWFIDCFVHPFFIPALPSHSEFVSTRLKSNIACDFDIIDQKTNPNICPVHFRKELGCSFGPPELVVCPDLGATLPLRLPKREQL